MVGPVVRLGCGRRQGLALGSDRCRAGRADQWRQWPCSPDSAPRGQPCPSMYGPDRGPYGPDTGPLGDGVGDRLQAKGLAVALVLVG